MYAARAIEVTNQIIEIVDQYKRSIDAKSSEIFKDENNSQSALIHILTKNKVEKQYTFEGDTKKKSFLDGFLGNNNE